MDRAPLEMTSVKSRSSIVKMQSKLCFSEVYPRRVSSSLFSLSTLTWSLINGHRALKRKILVSWCALISSCGYTTAYARAFLLLLRAEQTKPLQCGPRCTCDAAGEWGGRRPGGVQIDNNDILRYLKLHLISRARTAAPKSPLTDETEKPRNYPMGPPASYKRQTRSSYSPSSCPLFITSQTSGDFLHTHISHAVVRLCQSIDPRRRRTVDY